MAQQTSSKCFLIIPMLAYIKYDDGGREIFMGWLTKTYSIIWKKI